MYLIIENEEKNAKTEQNRSVAQTFVIFRYGAIFHHFVTPTPHGGLVPSSITLAPRGKLVFVVFTRSASRARFHPLFIAHWHLNPFFAITGFSLCDHPKALKKVKMPFSSPKSCPKSSSVHAGYFVVVVVVEVVVVSVAVAISISKSAGQGNLNSGRIKGS